MFCQNMSPLFVWFGSMKSSRVVFCHVSQSRLFSVMNSLSRRPLLFRDQVLNRAVMRWGGIWTGRVALVKERSHVYISIYACLSWIFSYCFFCFHL